MSLETLAPVHATHDIQRWPQHREARLARQGRQLLPSWSCTTYSVEFTPEGVPGATVNVSGLTEHDVQPDNRGPAQVSSSLA